MLNNKGRENMSDEKMELNKVLNSFDTELKPISEAEILDAIGVLRRKLNLKDFPFEFISELMAFGSNERDMLDEESKGKTIFTILSKNDVTPEIIIYWEQRLNISKNPILKARYATLIWDQKKNVTGESPDYRLAQIAIDSVIAMANSNRHSSDVSVRIKLKNALHLSILLHDNRRIEKVRDSIIAYEDITAKDDMPGTWGFSFDVFWNNHRVKLNDNQWNKITSDLERRLKAVSGLNDSKKCNPYAAEKASYLLALYYKSKKRKNDVKRVLDFGNLAFETSGLDASPMIGISFMERIHSVYKEFGFKSEADEITKKIRKMGPRIKSELKQFSHKIEIPKEKLDEAIRVFTKDDLGKSLSKIAHYFIPKKYQIEDQLKLLSELAPLSFHLSTSVLDHEGRIICKVGSLDDDKEGNMIRQVSDNMNYMGLYLNIVLNSIKQKFGENEQPYIEYISKSPVFLEDSKPILKAGFKEYLQDNHLYAIHLLIPQIECAFRQLLQLAGGSVLKSSYQNGWDFKLLHEILCDPILLNIFGEVGEDMINYFKTLLTDRRGWNLRNSICHGIFNPHVMEAVYSDRVVHVILCLGQVKQEKIDSS